VTEVCANSCFASFFSGSAKPFLTLAIYIKNDRDYIYFESMLIVLFLVTILGVPQSITLLNLFFMGSSSSYFLTADAAAFGFVYGANNYFLSSAILFYFSVNCGLPSSYSSSC
jgi:hypothetical protein